LSSYHRILDIPPGADEQAIKKAFRKKALQLHPDHNQSPTAEAEFIELTIAYEHLTSKRNHSAPATISENERIRDEAKAYARMRYEKFIRRNTAYERLSIHKIFWGKNVTVLILIISCVFMYDNFAPKKEKTLSGFKVEKNEAMSTRSSYNYYKVSGDGISFSTRDGYEVLKSRKIIVSYTPIIGVISSFRSDYDRFTREYSPTFSLYEFTFLPVVIFVVTLVTLLVKVRTFENKLLLKFMIIIAMITYLIVLLIAKL